MTSLIWSASEQYTDSKAKPLCWTLCESLHHQSLTATSLMKIRIMFTHEFRFIDSAVSIEQLRMRLKDTELEQYGEPFIPEFVYEVIRRLPRFSTMRVSSGPQSPITFTDTLSEDTNKTLRSSLASFSRNCTMSVPEL